MKRSIFFVAVLVLGEISQAKADQVPILVSGFNEQMVVGSAPVTATMDGGTGLGGDTWYSQAFGAANGNPGTGLASGVQTSLSDPSTTLRLAPFTANDTLMLDASGGPSSGTFTLTSPGKYSSLSFFASTGSAFSGAPRISVTLHFADASTFSSSFFSPDWFFNSPVAVGANGRWNYIGGFFDGPFAPPYPAIYQEDIGAIPFSSALTSIDLSFPGGYGGHTAVWGVSGTAVPEPATLTLLGIGIAGMAGYIWRRRKLPNVA